MIPVYSTACPDWEKRIVAGKSLIPFAPLFPDMAEAALRVFRELCIVDMSPKEDGSPFTMGEVSRDWLLDFVACVFGCYDPESGRRLIREFLLLIAKKNTKSTSAAGIMLTALILNWRRSAEMNILSPTKEIADNSFYPARDMIKADAELSDLLHVQEHFRTITHRATGAILKVIAADSESAGGKKGSINLVDELWLFGKRPGAENMLREATGGMASRPEGFVMYLSTQSDEPPAGIMRQKLNYARRVRDGLIVDNQFLPVLYEFPDYMLADESFKNPKHFYITNPNLGASVDEEFLVRELKKANDAGEESLRGFYAKNLNVEIGIALMSQAWAGAQFWEANAEPMDLPGLLQRCEVVTVGIDGGGLDDMLGMAVVGREVKSDRWLCWCHAWIHPIVLEKRKQEAARFRDFEKDGDLTIVDAIGEDVDGVAAIVEKCEQAGILERIGVDQAGINSVVTAIVARGIEIDRIVGVTQGWKMQGSIKTTERKLAETELLHPDSKLMNWTVGNARVEPRGNAITITKQKSGSAKIDCLMALFNAVTLMSLNPQPRTKNFEIAWI
jgi:phage terminase large subunit-like protein